MNKLYGIKVPVIILLLLLSSFSKVPPGQKVLYKMYQRYHGQWRTSLKFIQQTEKYRNDSLISTSTWYETMVYPRMFRIDFGAPADGNCVIFRNDSAYFFKERRQVRSIVDSNDLLFFLGGMYFVPFGEVMSRFSAMHYDLTRSYSTTWKGKPVYVVGAGKEGEQENQLWIEKEHFSAVRFIKYDDGQKQEGIMDAHEDVGGTWCETLVTFYIDGHLRQKERYTDIRANDAVDPVLFSPADPWKYHWAPSAPKN